MAYFDVEYPRLDASRALSSLTSWASPPAVTFMLLGTSSPSSAHAASLQQASEDALAYFLRTTHASGMVVDPVRLLVSRHEVSLR